MTGFHKARYLTATLLLLAYFTIVRAQAGGDPRIGTWKLNLEKSQYTVGVGPQAPIMGIRRLESRPDGFIVFTQIGLNGLSNPIFIQSTYKLDGKSYPEYTQTSLADLSAASAEPNRNTYKLIDSYTVEITRFDTSGRVTGGSTQVLSRDGRTHTSTNKDASGKVLATQVWDKQ
jgi:hypothetical protein